MMQCIEKQLKKREPLFVCFANYLRFMSTSRNEIDINLCMGIFVKQFERRANLSLLNLKSWMGSKFSGCISMS